MNCKHCDKKMRKLCKKFKRYEEFQCKLEVSHPLDSMGDISDSLVDDFMMELEETLFGDGDGEDD